MDPFEATRIVFSRIQNLDPENVSRIMGLLLIQDHGEKEMIRLAFGPETLVHTVVLKARQELGLSSPTNASSPSSPPVLTTNPFSLPRQTSSSSILGLKIPPLTIPNPSSSTCSSAWSPLSDLPKPEELISPNNSSLNPASVPFYSNGAPGGRTGTDLIDELNLQDQLAFLNENSGNIGLKKPDLFYSSHLDSLASPTTASSDTGLYPSYLNSPLHRRSCSVSDVLGSDETNSGFGWRPCLYYARGFCKNGSNCRFVHGGLGAMQEPDTVVCPSKKMEMLDQCHELLRSKSFQQQKLSAASQLMSSSFPYSSKCMNLNFLLQQQNESPNHRFAAALLMGEDLNNLGRGRLDRNDLINPASRQIYLTFPADSTFREEDVSNYFSIYGPVQDVRIPYQQKRMFGFVTFVYPETVKIILAKGNPHYVCDARVLVKPYKEKGKVPDKYRKQQQVERGEFSSPTGFDSPDSFDLPLGAKMFHNAQDILWRKKIGEQADIRQALDLQTRRLMGLQLLDMKKHHHHRALSAGSPIPSPTQSQSIFNHSVEFPPLHSSMESHYEKPGMNTSEKMTRNEDKDLLQECLEHNLPDSPFASPKKCSGEYFSAFLGTAKDAEKENSASSGLETSFPSLNCQIPRFSPGHGGMGMCAGSGGPTCPVGI